MLPGPYGVNKKPLLVTLLRGVFHFVQGFSGAHGVTSGKHRYFYSPFTLRLAMVAAF